MDEISGFAKSAYAKELDVEMTKSPQFEPVAVSKYPIPESLDVACG